MSVQHRMSPSGTQHRPASDSPPREGDGPLRVAVVGAGHMGKEHARIYAAMAGVELAAVADPDEKAGRGVARRCRTRWTPSPEELLSERLDAVSVAAPTVLHHALCRPFLEAGVSVLVEKPIADSVDDAEDLVRAARAGRARLQVGHVERFNPAIAALRERHVRPMFIECHRLSPFKFRSADIGVVFDLMIHDIDIIRSLVQSPIQRIDAVGVNVISESEDIANARIVFESGCVANVTASRVSIKSMRKIRLFAPDCYISIDYGNQQAIVYRKSGTLTRAEARARLRERAAAAEPSSRIGRGIAALRQLKDVAFNDLLSVEEVKLDRAEPLKRELDAFVQCVREGTAPVVSGEDGLEAVRTAHAILAAIRQSMKALEKNSGSPH